MNEIQYIGEHLLPGKIGHLAIILGFVSSLLAAVAYYLATRREDPSWKMIGRASFGLHGLSVFTVIGVIFFVMINKYYEYQYVYAHVNEDLPFQYIFSAFWEGQEGSFLLWMFWHVILGLILMRTAKKWESPVLSVISLVQVFIMSMILGVYFGWGDDPLRVGSSPVLLLRDTMEAPIFNNADYLSLIKGTGLNPLLQNYWMTIHPPTLFLGFASTVVPFAYAIGGLITGQHKAWLKPALPWALFSGAILGIGILMGGAWAYEALSFGGYWAWDPVENMSLVPWLILIAGIHTHLVARNTGHSIRSTYLFYLLTFALVVYSTFLTRSGVLGDTSVHAFTEMGLENQLLLFLVASFLMGLIPFFVRFREIPAPKKEEALASKEFWMFIGALVLVFSAGMITATTSLPVYNKIREFFNPAFDGKVITEPVAFYNKYQLWIAVFIGLLSGFTQFLRWKEQRWSKNRSRFLTHTAIGVGGAVVLTLLVSWWIDLYAWQYVVMLFFGLYTLVSNVDYLISFIGKNLKKSASAFAHIGFGLMIVGILASGLNQFHISTNPFAQRGLIESERLDRNIMLFEDMPMYMSGYKVTYERDTFVGNNRVYDIRFQEIREDGKVVRDFTVQPTALYDNKITKVAAYNPDTKHYLHKDIFTHIASIPLSEADVEFARETEDSLDYKKYWLPTDGELIIYDTVTVRDSQLVRTYYFQLDELLENPQHSGYEAQEGDLTVGARIKMEDQSRDISFSAEPMLALRGSLLYTYPVQVQDMALKVRLDESIIDQVFVPEDLLKYESLTFRQGDEKNWGDYSIRFEGFNKQPEHPNYEAEEGDIAVGARFTVVNTSTGETSTVEPVYLIRGNQPFNLKDIAKKSGLHFRFTGLDPVEETIQLALAQQGDRKDGIPIEVAYSPRTDFIVLESIVFPGINLFWLGSSLMMLGLLIGMFNRIQGKRDGSN